jgi:hypothetical protein
MYGSDWNILAREAGHETYLEDWAATAPMLQPADAGFARDFFGGNARRFLGLYPGTKTWTRLQRFYAGGPAPRWFAEAPDAGGA